jgi:hypothetical protein
MLKQDDVPVVYGSIDGGDYLRHVYNNGGNSFEQINETWANITKSITQFLRSAATNFSTPAAGQSLIHTTCLRVHWGWIAYPAIMTILTLILFVLLGILGVSQRMPTWKDSPLAWILHGPGRSRPLVPANPTPARPEATATGAMEAMEQGENLAV